MPDAPIGFDESTPPDMLTGKSPPSSVAPDVGHLPALALGQIRWPSSHIGSYHENGT